MIVVSPSSSCARSSCDVAPSADMSAQIDSESLFLEEPYDGDYLVKMNLPYSGTVTGMTVLAQSGTGKASLRIDSDDILGLVEKNITSSQTEYLPTGDNTFTEGQNIYLTVSDNLIMLNMAVTVAFRRDAAGTSTTIVSDYDNLVADDLTLTGDLTVGGTIAGNVLQAATLKITTIPTSASGLTAGQVWSNGGVLTIV